jgi:hypothetical protein
MISKRKISEVQQASLAFIFLVLVLGLLLVIYEFSFAEDEAQRSQKVAVLKLLGVASLSLSSDCISTRNPIEGIYGCLSDIPGGYCYHTSCDIICVPELPNDFSFVIKVISHKGIGTFTTDTDL